MKAEISISPEIIDSIADAVVARLADRLAPAQSDGWLDTRAAADYAGCTINSLHKAMAAREVTFEQDCKGGKAWFRRSAIDEWRSGVTPLRKAA